MKKSFFFFCMLLLLFSSSVSAHTGLKNSSPTDGEIVTENLQEIDLQFETAIEDGSGFSLLSESGIEVSMEQLDLTENKMTAKIEDPLEDGQYTVNWRIVGEDGHVIEGTYSFIVQLANEKSGENNPTSVAAESMEETNTTAATDDETEKNETNSNIIIPLAAGFMLFVALQTAMWLIKRKKT